MGGLATDAIAIWSNGVGFRHSWIPEPGFVPLCDTSLTGEQGGDKRSLRSVGKPSRTFPTQQKSGLYSHWVDSGRQGLGSGLAGVD